MWEKFFSGRNEIWLSNLVYMTSKGVLSNPSWIVSDSLSFSCSYTKVKLDRENMAFIFLYYVHERMFLVIRVG